MGSASPTLGEQQTSQCMSEPTRRKRRPRRNGAVERRQEVSAGAVVWRRRGDGRIEVALVRPAGKDAWVLPKGNIEAGESRVEAAMREVGEETGLTVTDVKPLGDVSYVYSRRERSDAPLLRIFKTVHFFLMRQTGGDTTKHDHEIDEVAWFDIDSAQGRASYASERGLIAGAKRSLQG